MVVHFRSLLILLFLFCCIQCRSNQVSTEIVGSEQITQAMYPQSGVHVVVTSCQYHGYSYNLSTEDLFYMLSVKGKVIIPSSHANLGTLSKERGKVVIVAVPSTEALYLDAVDEYVEGMEYTQRKIYWKKDTMIYSIDFDGNEDQNIDCILNKDDHTKLSKGEYVVCLIYRKAKDQSYYSICDRRNAVGTIAVRDSRMNFSNLKSALQGNKIEIKDQDVNQNKPLDFSLKIQDSSIIPDHSEIHFIVDTNQNSKDLNSQEPNIIREFLKNRTFGRDNLSRPGVDVVPAQFEQGKITAHWYPKEHLSGGIDVYLYIGGQDGYVYYPLVSKHSINYTVEKTISLKKDSNVAIQICQLIDNATGSLLEWMRVDTRVSIDNAPQGNVYILLAHQQSPNTRDVQQHLTAKGQGTSSGSMDWYLLKQEDTSHHIVLNGETSRGSAQQFSKYKVYIVTDGPNHNKIVVWESEYKTLPERVNDIEKHELESVPIMDSHYTISRNFFQNQDYNSNITKVQNLYSKHIKVMKEMFACFRDQIGFVVYLDKSIGNGHTYQNKVMSDVKAFLYKDSNNELNQSSDFVLIREGEKDKIPDTLFEWINGVCAQRRLRQDVFAYLKVWRLDQDGHFIPLGSGLGCRMLKFAA